MEVCSRTPEQLLIFVSALAQDAVRLCIDSNGNHVIQRTLQYLVAPHNQFVFDAVAMECTTIGTHRHGCCVLQRCLDAASPAQKTLVIAQVEAHAMKLMQDPYGNYVVQYVLDTCGFREARGVMCSPLGHVFELSVQKFSSNVIEKCLEKASNEVRLMYLYEIMNCPKISRMLQDQFANYVVQRALTVCDEASGLQLVRAIIPHLAGIKNTSGGRRITARMLKRFPSLSLDLGGGGPSSSSSLTSSSSSTPMVHTGVHHHSASSSHLHVHPPVMVPGGLYRGATEASSAYYNTSQQQQQQQQQGNPGVANFSPMAGVGYPHHHHHHPYHVSQLHHVSQPPPHYPPPTIHGHTNPRLNHHHLYSPP